MPRRRKKEKRELTPLQQDAARLKERSRLIRRGTPDLVQAKEQLRQYAAQWLAAVRSRCGNLAEEVNGVLCAIRSGSVLDGLMSTVGLEKLSAALGDAGCAAADLTVLYHDMPIIDLVRLADRVSTTEYPLAGAVAKALAEPKG